MNTLKKALLVLAFVPLLGWAAEGTVHLPKAPGVQGNPAALQNGAKLFVNYCLNCHGASFVRYQRLTELGLTDQQVIDNLLFTAEKIGEPMRIAARPAEQAKWFGVAPPDLSLVARARATPGASGADWLYAYLRAFYRDDQRPTGWNNSVFPNVAMPHVLAELQGQQVMNPETKQLELAVPGQLSPAEFDKEIADLVGFLVWAAEPGAGFRKQLGVGVIAFLLVLFGFAYALKKEYWKDVGKD